MKIVFLSVFYPFRGGIAQFSSALLKALKERKIKVKALNFKRQYPKILFPGKTQVVEKTDDVEAYHTEQIIDSINPITYLQAYKFVNKQKAEVLLVNYWMTFFAYCQGFIAKKAKVEKKIAILHNLIPHEKRFYDNFVNRYFLKQFDAFVVMSEQVKTDLLSMKADAKFIQLEHPNYVHFGEKSDKLIARNALNIPQDKKVVLFFGLIRKYKGLDVLLEAFAALNDDYLLLVAGECYDDFSIYQDLIDKHELKEKVQIHNEYISDKMVATFFSSSDLCVLPYKSATQSGIVAVANHFEVPLIATNVGNFPQSIKHEKEGLIVEKSSAKQLASSIQRFFDENRAQNFILNIQQKNQKLSWDFFAQELEDFIQKC